MTEPEDAVRRALHEVAGRPTPTPATPPPPRATRVVPCSPMAPEPRPAASCSAPSPRSIAVVAGVLVAALASGDDDARHRRDRRRHDHDRSTDTTTSSTSTLVDIVDVRTTATTATSTSGADVDVSRRRRARRTAVPIAGRRGRGAGASSAEERRRGLRRRRVRRRRPVVDRDLRPRDAGRAAGRHPRPARSRSRRQRRRLCSPGATTASTAYERVRMLDRREDALGRRDPFIDGCAVLVTDQARRRSCSCAGGGRIRGRACTADELVTEALFEPLRHVPAGGGLAEHRPVPRDRRLHRRRTTVRAGPAASDPSPAVVADACWRRRSVRHVLVADERPDAARPVRPRAAVGRAGSGAASCPTATSCGTGLTPVRRRTSACSSLSATGRSRVDDGAPRSITSPSTVGETRFEVPVPPA